MSKSKRNGQGLVEFALILPILILLLLGIAEGAHVIQAYVGAQSAVRAAARYAVSGQPLNAVGDPWTKTPEERLPFIKTVAISESVGVGYTRVVTQLADYNACLNSSTSACAGTLGVRVDSVQYSSNGTINNSATIADYPGNEGNDVRVSLYHNVVIWDPIYAAIVEGVARTPYFPIRAEIVMRNEGGPPLTGIAPTPEADSGGSPGTGSGPSSTPVIEIQDGTTHPVGETIYIRIRFHDPNTPYNIYVGDVLVPTSPATTNAQGEEIIPYQIPYERTPGTYVVESRTVAGTTIATTQLTLVQSINPIIITNGDVWPLGGVFTYSLASHLPSSSFDMQMSKGGTVRSLPAQTTNASGNSVTASEYVIATSSFTTGAWIIGSRIGSTTYASRTLTLIQGCVMLNQGSCGQSITTPNGVFIEILLTNHARNRVYRVELLNTTTGDKTDVNTSVTTDDQGSESLSYFLPMTMANGTYTIRTYDINPLSQIVAQTNFVVNTPTTAFIPVIGGYSWPAGSKILFQLRNHTPSTRYDIFWEGTRIISNTAPTNINGMLELSYKIPITMSQGYSYTLQSRPHGSTVTTYTAQSADIEIIAQPYLSIAEGSPQVPGATVTVELHNHSLNTRYRVYVDEPNIASPGRELPGSSVTTNKLGNSSIKYTIPANEPTGGVITITSYLRNETPITATAQTTLSLLAADLQVLNIQIPPNPNFNQEVPVTVTIINAAPVTITQQSFDVDLYLDPVEAPNLGRSLPPGEVKVWLQPPLAYSQTRVFTTMLPIYGANTHILWARADTSNRVQEGLTNCLTNPSSLECNNLRSLSITPYSCAYTYTASALATTQRFGNAALNSYTVNAGTGLISLSNNGSSATKETTDASSSGNLSGYVFAYHQISGNFDVRVRAVSQAASSGTLSADAIFGLEIRNSLDPASDKLMLGTTYGRSLRYWSRVGGAFGPSDDYLGVSTKPVWLRIVRADDEFTLYYSTSTQNPPASDQWVQLTSLTLSGMQNSVYLGLNNTPYSTSRQSNVTFDRYNVCAAPSGSETCGEVRESAGLAVIKANNTVNNPTGWVPASRAGWIGYSATGNYPTITNSPGLRYGVNISKVGTYYVWLLGYSPGAGNNEVYVGLNTGSAVTMSQSTYTTLGWFGGGSAVINFSTLGANTFSIWMRESGFELYQILLTRDAGFTPDIGTTYPASQCSMGGTIDIPPGLQECNSVVTNGNFENDSQMTQWNYQSIAQQVTRTSVPHYFASGESFSMLLPATNLYGVPRRPWLYQAVQMPGWIITPTVNSDEGTSLNLKLHVAVNPEGPENPDPLEVVLKNQAGTDISQPITITTGATPPFIDPDNPNPNNSEWVYKTLALDDAFSPLASLLDYEDQPIRLHFFSPNPAGTYSTRFYIDNISLDVCTMQPIPRQFSTKVSGNVYVWLNDSFVEKPGVFVWIYAIDGSMQKSYTIQNSTFSFYNLPASTSGTKYIIYAEYLDDGVLRVASSVIILKPGQRIEDLMLLLF